MRKRKRPRRKPGSYDPLNPPEVKVIASWSSPAIPLDDHIIYDPSRKRPYIVIWDDKMVGFYAYKDSAIGKVRELEMGG